MKKLIIGFLLTISVNANAGTAFFEHEVNTGGMIKQCVYSYLGSRYVINVKSYELCPLTIDV